MAKRNRSVNRLLASLLFRRLVNLLLLVEAVQEWRYAVGAMTQRI